MRVHLLKCLLRPIGALIFFVAAVATNAAELPEGTLLFLENCSSVVERSTHGEIAHVAMVFGEASQRWVYEATPAKVRRVKIEDYLVELARSNERRKANDKIGVLALRPQPEYSPDEAASMRTFLDRQLGRRYSVKNYVRGKPYDGIHCAELTASTLNASGRFAYSDCHKINPQSLYELVAATHAAPERLAIPALEVEEPWYVRMQRQSLGWWTWCRWSCREAWLFLW
jgi:hypothetical protein